MGIPVYFKTLITDYQDIILEKNKLNDIHSLFLDLNCLIHPCCQKCIKDDMIDETIMIESIIDSIRLLIEYTGVTDLLFIAIDGVAPKGKMRQQRGRRYKSAYENKKWDTNAISPGTFFMNHLNHHLKEFQKGLKSLKCIVSDSNERGEGEHKILDYIRNHPNEKRNVIYGLDADLIMLSLVSQRKNIYLLRERTEYNIEDTGNEYIYLRIDELRKCLLETINSKGKEEQIIDDYIFLCFLLGNDFVLHIPSLNLRYGAHDKLIKVYQKLQERYSGYYQLIDRKLKHIIHLPFLKEFILELSFIEKDLLYHQKNIRKKQYNKIYGKYNELYKDFQKYCKSQIQIRKSNSENKTENITMEDIYNYQQYSTYSEENISMMIVNLPLLENKDIQNYYHHKANDINDYIQSLLWCAHYYFRGCIHWRWSTKSLRAPYLRDLMNELDNYTHLEIEENSNEYTIKEQLEYIFPSRSHQLHDMNCGSKEYILIPDLYHKRYLWECEIEFIDIN